MQNSLPDGLQKNKFAWQYQKSDFLWRGNNSLSCEGAFDQRFVVTGMQIQIPPQLLMISLSSHNEIHEEKGSQTSQYVRYAFAELLEKRFINRSYLLMCKTSQTL